MKITGDNVNEGIYVMQGVAQIHSPIHSFMQKKPLLRFILDAGDAEMNKVLPRSSQSNEMLENNCNKV